MARFATWSIFFLLDSDIWGRVAATKTCGILINALQTSSDAAVYGNRAEEGHLISSCTPLSTADMELIYRPLDIIILDWNKLEAHVAENLLASL